MAKTMLLRQLIIFTTTHNDVNNNYCSYTNAELSVFMRYTVQLECSGASAREQLAGGPRAHAMVHRVPRVRHTSTS